jgi:hypothetical protein
MGYGGCDLPDASFVHRDQGSPDPYAGQSKHAPVEGNVAQVAQCDADRYERQEPDRKKQQ